MDQRFLDFYNQELRHIRETAAGFAVEFPKIAGRLGLDNTEISDPYVERLLEGFAFLTARIQLKLDSRFPRFTQHLLEIIYPHYHKPLPSITIAQLNPKLREGTLSKGFVVEPQTALHSVLGKNERTACEFRTAHSLTLWPLEVTQASYYDSDSALAFDNWHGPKHAKAGIKLSLKSTNDTAFSELNLDELVFHLSGHDELPMRLYEQVFAHSIGAQVRAKGIQKQTPEFISQKSILPVGFDQHEALLPDIEPAFSGYRVLQEYFAFPQRFMFFKLVGLTALLKNTHSTELEIVILLNKSDKTLGPLVNKDLFQLNCTPAINLFPKRGSRINLAEAQHDHHVVIDRTRPQDFEVYRIEEVSGYSADNDDKQRFAPFYGQNHEHLAEGNYYTSYREPRLLSSKQKRHGTRSNYIGSEVFLAAVETSDVPLGQRTKQLDLKLLCTNRDLPLFMPTGRGRTDFTLGASAPVDSIRCLNGPSKPVPAQPPSETSWKFINHLSLNYLSLVNQTNNEAAQAIQSMLKLYINEQDASQVKQVEALRRVSSKPIVRRLPVAAGHIAYGRGLEISMEVDESGFEGFGFFLFGAVMEQFFARYTSINSFTELVLISEQRGIVKRWPARSGCKQIL